VPHRIIGRDLPVPMRLAFEFSNMPGMLGRAPSIEGMDG
jgi:hypothetical protein